MLADRRFLAETRHAFLIRRPEEIACTRTPSGNSRELARFAAHHRPFYEQLYAQRLDVTPWEHNAGP